MRRLEHGERKLCLPEHRVGVLGCCLPGAWDEKFVLGVTDVVFREHSAGEAAGAWKATPSLYSLWSLTSAVTVELFADSVNESGVISALCSPRERDKYFGSLGRWEDNVPKVAGGAANQPFNLQKSVCSSFEHGVRRSLPYCRCAVLSLSRSGGVVDNITGSLSSHGHLLLAFPQSSVPFKSQDLLLSTQTVHPQPCQFQEVGPFVWVHRSYLELYPPPADVEAAYLRWATHSTGFPQGSNLHSTSFKAAFPLCLRSDREVDSLFAIY